MKLVIVIFFLFCFRANAEEYFALKKKESCYVKSYVNKEFRDQRYKDFLGMKLLARPHKKNPEFMLFKLDGTIYVTKKRCLERVEIDEDLEDLPDSKPEEDYSYLNKVKSHNLESLKFNENKYMIEIDAGTTLFSSKDQVYSDYSDASFVIDGDSIDFDENATKSKYNGNNLISLTLGYKVSELTFLQLKLKRYSGTKTDEVGVRVNGTPVTNMKFKYEDSFTSILFGGKFLFFENSKIKPSIGLLAGLSTIDSRVSYAIEGYSGRFDEKFRSPGLSAQVDIGIELFITDHISIGAAYGLEYLGTRTFRVVDKNDEVTNTGYKTKMSYTNTFATGGLKFYF